MIDVTYTIDKSEVYNEVAKTTSYTGSKMDDDANAYNRIYTTDEDREMLERFYQEAKNALLYGLKRVLSSYNEKDNILTLNLSLPSNFEEALKDSIEQDIFSFFVLSIIAQWYMFTNKKEAATYSAGVVTSLEAIRKKVFSKKKPTRPVISKG